MLYGKHLLFCKDTDKQRELADGDVLVFSSLEGLAKFGYEPSNDASRERLERLFTLGEKAKFVVHYSCATRLCDNIVIANIRAINGFSIKPEYNFNAKQVTNDLVLWVRDYFNDNGKTSKAVIGISGGKDSSVVAKLCVEALGKERVLGVLMPCGEQADISYSQELCELLGIENVTVNIEDMLFSTNLEFELCFKSLGVSMSTVTTFNTPARLRMTVLYGIAGSVSGRVSCNSNLSEDYVGYATKYGDGAGDFAPLMNLTVTEVKAIGRELGLPEKFIEKMPIDGLCGKSDEDNLGFSYADLDKYIRLGVCNDLDLKAKIDTMNRNSLHKLKPIPKFEIL